MKRNAAMIVTIDTMNIFAALRNRLSFIDLLRTRCLLRPRPCLSARIRIKLVLQDEIISSFKRYDYLFRTLGHGSINSCDTDQSLRKSFEIHDVKLSWNNNFSCLVNETPFITTIIDTCKSF